MSESRFHSPSVGLGHRVDEIHTHKKRSILPWLILGLLALAFAGWSLMRNRADRAERAIDTSTRYETPSAAPDTDRPSTPTETPR